jgi:hypothetical protein
MADVHRLGHIGRAEIQNHSARFSCRLEEEVFTTKRRGDGPADGGAFEPEIQESRSSDFDGVTAFLEIETAEKMGRDLTRIKLPSLGQGHDAGGLIITEAGVGARTDQETGGVRIRE